MNPPIKNYLNVYQYLQDCYQLRKKAHADFSYDAWARELGASDKSYVRMMVLGRRPINEKMSMAFALSLKLDEKEKEYFLVLVEYTQSKTQEQKNLSGKKMMSLIRPDLERQEIKAHYDFLSNPLLPRLQVFLSFEDLDQSPENLSWLLGATSLEVAEGIQKLFDVGMIQKENNRWKPLKRSFKVPDSFGDLGLEIFYTKNLEAAKEAIFLPKERRRFKSLFLPLNPDEFEEYLANLQLFVNDQIFKFNPDEYANRILYQVHFNIIPVSSPVGKSHEDGLERLVSN
jgi:uncharacterized protein (TIGR02147 family)